MTRIGNLDDHPDPFVTPEQLAAHLSVSVDTIHRAIRTGTLPAVRVGPRLLRVRTEDARQFLRPVNATPSVALKKRPRKRAR
jgi:excisionase family DNA binding protein